MQIKTETEYNAICQRIEELLKVVGNKTSKNNKNFIELNVLSDLVADYEAVNFPIPKPTLTEVIRLRMYEMDLSQNTLSKMLGISASRISEYLNGKKEPTLKIARKISKVLNIDAEIVLGV